MAFSLHVIFSKIWRKIDENETYGMFGMKCMVQNNMFDMNINNK